MRRIASAIVVGGLVAGGLVVGSAPAHAAKGIVVWADAAHAPIIADLTSDGFQGTPVSVVIKDPANVRAELAAVQKAAAPDVIWGDLAWTGELASSEAIVPVGMPKKIRAKFRPNVLVGSNVAGVRYGVPVQISNLALITNTKLIPKQPATFEELSAMALALKSKKKIKVPFALPQSEGTSPWSTYPLFSALGGYLFARGSNGALNLEDVGIASKSLRQNSGQIDTWNSSGLVDSTLTAERARTVFAESKSPFMLAGPEDLSYLMGLKFPYRISTVPPITKSAKAVPLLTVHGFMVTRWAAEHGVFDQASKLVKRKMAKAKSQQELAGASGWFPANLDAAATVPTGGGRIRAIGNAGAYGVTMPNAPQAAALWQPYATAWSTSTSGPAATPAKQAFREAQRAAKAALAQG